MTDKKKKVNYGRCANPYCETTLTKDSRHHVTPCICFIIPELKSKDGKNVLITQPQRLLPGWICHTCFELYKEQIPEESDEPDTEHKET